MYIITTKEGVTVDWCIPLNVCFDHLFEEEHSQSYYWTEKGFIYRVVGDTYHA